MIPKKADAMSSQTVISMVNTERTKAGLAPMAASAELQKSSRSKAADMFARGYWAHNAPDGSEPWHFFKESGYKFTQAGENLAKSFQTPDGVVKGWMNSPTHRANILNPAYRDIGISAVDGALSGEPTTLVVAHFGARNTSQPKVVKKTRPAAAAQAAAAAPISKLPDSRPIVHAAVSPAPELKLWEKVLNEIIAGVRPRQLLGYTYLPELRLNGLLPVRWT